MVAPDFADALAACIPGFAASADHERVTLILADTLCSALAAEALAAVEDNILTRAAGLASAAGPVTAWGTGVKGALEAIALRNGVATRHLDYNDTYTGKVIVHPSDMIATLVGLAEARQIDWPRLIEAVAVAYETLCLLADQSQTRRNGFDPATLIPLAVAAGAGHLLGLQAGVIADAIRLAALDASVLRCIRLGKIADWRAVAAARNAVKALLAVSMAEAGTQGPPGTFESEDGFFAHISGPLAVDVVPAPRFGQVLTKRFPAQIFIQSYLDLAEAIHGELKGSAADIVGVTIATNAEAVRMVGPRPAHATLNRETADHSAAFCVASMLVTGRFGPDDLDHHLANETILATAGQTTMEILPEGTPRHAAVVTARLSDGRVIERRREAPEPPSRQRLAYKLDTLWPRERKRDWAWTLPGEAPAFPG